MKHRPIVGAALALSLLSLTAGLVPACTEQQTAVAAIAGCATWNQLERGLSPKIPAMSETEHAIFLGGFDYLSGGTPTAPTGDGICRKPVPPAAADLANALVGKTLARLQPLVTKYLSK